MLRDLESPKHSPQARFGIARSRVLCIAIVQALLLTSAVCEASPVRAAAPAIGDTFTGTAYLKVNLPGNPLCANRDYPVLVVPQVGGTLIYQGQKEELAGTSLAGIAIEGFTQDTGVATVAPRKVFSGFDTEDPVPGAARFTLHTSKPGRTNLYFEALFRKARIQNPTDEYAGPTFPITVVPCRFRITISAATLGQIPNITETALYSAVGEMSGEGALTGNAKVSWKTQQASSCFVTKQSVPNSTATLEGNMSGDGSTLTVQVTFAPATLSNSVRFTCGFGAASDKQLQLQPAPISVTVPTTGGSVSQSVAQPVGAVVLNGRARITVEPIEAK